MARLVYLLSCAAIISTFTLNSIAFESLNKTSFEGQRLDQSSFILVISYAFVLLVSTLCKLALKQRNFAHLFTWELMIASVACVVSLESTINLGFTLDYTFAVIFRSSKFLSVLLSSIIFGSGGRHKEKPNLWLGTLTTLGLILFATDGEFTRTSQLVGFFYGFLSLFADCVVSHFQSKLDRDRFDFVSIMQVMNFWNLLASFGLCLLKGEMTSAVQFIWNYPPAGTALLTAAMSFGLGSLFIFFHLNRYGPVNLSYVTTLRKIGSIFLSLLLFPNSISLKKAIGVALIVGCIAIDVLETVRRIRSKSKCQKVTE